MNDCKAISTIKLTTRGLNSAAYLVGNVGTEVDGKGQSNIVLLNNITKLFTALKLVFFQPLFQKLLAVLKQDRLGELNRFKAVKLTLLKQNAKVLKNGGELTRSNLNVLEAFNCFSSSKDSARGIGRDFCCFTVRAGGEKLIKALNVQIICSGQTTTRS